MDYHPLSVVSDWLHNIVTYYMKAALGECLQPLNKESHVLRACVNCLNIKPL
jgi:hypothetical protein